MPIALSPFHEGEQRVQEALGVRESIEPWARKVVRDHLTAEHREFFSALPFVVAAARDRQGRPWATLLAGSPGFISSPDPGRLALAVAPVDGDALGDGFGDGAEVGLLGIELDTRRRNRVNGRIRARRADRLEFDVKQSFGNCPQYVTPRGWVWTGGRSGRVERARALSPALQRRVREADTLFLATGHAGDADSAVVGMDASHRGGAPGFVEVVSERELVLPDYAGNNHFNTIGNLVMDPRIGVTFVDFESGGLVQLTGTAVIEWETPDPLRYPSAQRLLRIFIDAVNVVHGALPLRWREDTAGLGVRIAAVTRESAAIRSFELEPVDGAPLPDFQAGQHLPLTLADDAGGVLERSYSLSNAPRSGRYRISVKREPRGAASRRLHDELGVGDELVVRRPAGDFLLAAGRRPVVLVGAGVGATPLLSMLHKLVDDADEREVCFVQIARNGADHAFGPELRGLALRSPRVTLSVCYTRPADDDRPGVDFDRAGRPDAAAVLALAGTSEVDVYLCGPTTFMASMSADLERLGVTAANIHSETFGPVGAG